MKRVVFILITLGLFLLAELVTQLALMEHAKGKPPKASPAALQMHDIDFYYRMDAPARYLDLASQWQNSHAGAMPVKIRLDLAEEAYRKSDMEASFAKWRFHGGPAPDIFSARLHLFNTGKDAYLDVPVHVTVRARVGELRVDPEIQMTDAAHLAQTARWETVSTSTVTIPAIAPGEDMLVPLMTFNLPEFLSKHPNRWPQQVQVQIESMGKSFRKEIELLPDHFVVPGVQG